MQGQSVLSGQDGISWKPRGSKPKIDGDSNDVDDNDAEEDNGDCTTR